VQVESESWISVLTGFSATKDFQSAPSARDMGSHALGMIGASSLSPGSHIAPQGKKPSQISARSVEPRLRLKAFMQATIAKLAFRRLSTKANRGLWCTETSMSCKAWERSLRSFPSQLRRLRNIFFPNGLVFYLLSMGIARC
jgi:hypothetical protein